MLANRVGQILLGTPHAHPQPAPRQARAKTRLGAELDGPFDRSRGGPGGWVISDQPERRLGDHVVVPDIAYWRRKRMLDLPTTAYFDTPSDWVCEVLSPATMQIDRTDKLQIYAEFAVGHCWYIDPNAQTLGVFALDRGRWRPAGCSKDRDEIAAPPFDAHSSTLNVLWDV